MGNHSRKKCAQGLPTGVSQADPRRYSLLKKIKYPAPPLPPVCRPQPSYVLRTPRSGAADNSVKLEREGKPPLAPPPPPPPAQKPMFGATGLNKAERRAAESAPPQRTPRTPRTPRKKQLMKVLALRTWAPRSARYTTVNALLTIELTHGGFHLSRHTYDDCPEKFAHRPMTFLSWTSRMVLENDGTFLKLFILGLRRSLHLLE